MSAVQAGFMAMTVLACAGCAKELTPDINKRLAEANALGIPTELAQLRPPKPPDAENAAVDLADGTSLHNAMNDIRFPDSRETMRTWVKQHQVVLDQIARTADKKHHWIAPTDPEGLPNNFEGARGLNSAIRLLSIRAITSGWPEAKADLRRMQKLVRWLADAPSFVGTMVGSSAERVYVFTVLHISDLAETNLLDLQELRKLIADIPPYRPLSKDIEGEFCLLLWGTRNLNNPVLKDPGEYFLPFSKRSSKPNNVPIQVSGIPKDASGKDKYLRVLNDYLPYFRDVQSGMPSTEAISRLERRLRKSSKTKLELDSVDGFQLFMTMAARIPAFRNAALAGIDLMKVKKVEGVFPESFDMTPYQTKEVPVRYTRTKTGFSIRSLKDPSAVSLIYPFARK